MKDPVVYDFTTEISEGILTISVLLPLSKLKVYDMN